MKTRVITGAVAGALLIGALVLSAHVPVVLNIVFALIAAVAAYEAAGAAGVRHARAVTAASVLFAAYLPFAPMLSGCKFPVTNSVLFAYIFFLFAHQLFHHRDIAMPELIVTAFVTVFSAAALTSLVHIRDMGGRAHGIFLLVLALVSAWSADSGAYFAGVLFGKHKLCPEISPKKTVEGFVGGIVGCVIILEAVTLVYAKCIAPQTVVSYGAVALLAALASVISVVGDLSFSLLKRHYGIKDYGNIMPGHGGVLDRFDSVIFVAPFFALLMQYFPIIGA